MTPAEKAAAFVAEHRPNPDYRYEPPRKVRINGVDCIEMDAGILPWANDIAQRGAKLKFPKHVK